MGAKKRCDREFSGSTSVRTQVKFAELWARYLVSIELACRPRFAPTRNINIEASSLLLDTTSTEKRSHQYNKPSTLLYRYQYFDDLHRSKYYI